MCTWDWLKSKAYSQFLYAGYWQQSYYRGKPGTAAMAFSSILWLQSGAGNPIYVQHSLSHPTQLAQHNTLHHAPNCTPNNQLYPMYTCSIVYRPDRLCHRPGTPCTSAVYRHLPTYPSSKPPDLLFLKSSESTEYSTFPDFFSAGTLSRVTNPSASFW